MRVIAGNLRGRTFESPGGHRTHPMSEKIRGAIFNALGDLSGLTVLDAYAGSGALAIEALSRGATSAVAVDDDQKAFAAIVANAKSLGIASVLRVKAMSVTSWCSANPDQQFDIVLADPPYDNVKTTELELLAGKVRAGCLYVLSLPTEATLEADSTLQLLQRKSYGDATLAFYRKIS